MRVSNVRAIVEGTRGQGSADAFRLARVVAGVAAFVFLARAAVRRIQKDRPLGEPLRASVEP